MNENIDLMNFMYRVMEELTKEGVPVVFKGAMILNLAIKNNNPSSVERATHDIDGDWIGNVPTMDEMENALKKAVKKIDPELDVKIKREFGEHRAAGFKIVNLNNEKIASIDLSVRQNKFCESYYSYVGGATINGASISKMLSDKIYAISGERIFNRVKDILDIYTMSFITKIDFYELQNIWNETNRTLGEFSAFKTHYDELNIAYQKMKGIKNKPDFKDVYNRVNGIIKELDINLFINKHRNRKR